MTFATLLPFLLPFAAGFLTKHFDILGKAGGLLKSLAGPNPVASPAKIALPTLAPLTLGNHPVLSDAVNAAIKQAVADAVAGHITSVKSEIGSAVQAAVAAAVADLKPKS